MAPRQTYQQKYAEQIERIVSDAGNPSTDKNAALIAIAKERVREGSYMEAIGIYVETLKITRLEARKKVRDAKLELAVSSKSPYHDGRPSLA